jgi:predicted MPP superfamily phosphohydrolase
MRGFSFIGIAIFLGVLLLIDLYTFKGLKELLRNASNQNLRKIFVITYWIINLGIYTIWIYLFFKTRGHIVEISYKFVYTAFGIFLMFYLPKLIFTISLVINDVSLFLISLLKSNSASAPGELINRGTFITYLGAILSTISFFTLGWGMLVGRYRYKVHHKKLQFDSLPPEFDGFKIVQLSDLHVGSFFEEFDKVEAGLKMVMDLKPDMILFTGDMVNNYSKEAEPWINQLKSLDAPYGKYAILGNHDYGDYSRWPSKEAKAENLQRLKDIEKEMGFDLLLNENRKIEKNGQSFSLIGVENWGLPPFPQHGNLKKALEGSDDESFQILMSHDPSHFDAQVTSESDVDLTLSGHTHGMQFGVELGNIKWSPVKYKYPKWAGLYDSGKQSLYVNRGFGYIGFPGRVGIMPEITLIELSSKA